MSYPNILFGPEGEQLNTHTLQASGTGTNTGRWPFGTQLVLQDGRKFRYALAGGSDLVAGTLQQAAANVANHILQTPTAAAAGATTVTVALGATAVLQNEYLNGYLAIELGTGKGFIYPIGAHAAVVSSGSFAVPLAGGYSVQVAIPATSNSVSLIHNPYWKVIQMPTTYTQQPAGVAVVAVTSGKCGWLQTRGMASVLTNGTVVVGAPVVASGTTAGAIEAGSTTIATLVAQAEVGFVAHVASTTNQSTINLTIDG